MDPKFRVTLSRAARAWSSVSISLSAALMEESGHVGGTACSESVMILSSLLVTIKRDGDLRFDVDSVDSSRAVRFASHDSMKIHFADIRLSMSGYLYSFVLLHHSPNVKYSEPLNSSGCAHGAHLTMHQSIDNRLTPLAKSKSFI